MADTSPHAYAGLTDDQITRARAAMCAVLPCTGSGFEDEDGNAILCADFDKCECARQVLAVAAVIRETNP